ncbi:MAG: hypothetical protein QNJ51_00815 [Calothrix sp. MO_167.B12]|nr:hypothetical protein [Calothrix sp. MO_167.B12]
MARTQKISKNASRVYRSLVATAFITSGIFQFVAPALAEGTAGGQKINNTATATYEDPNNPGTTLNATSNTVEVTIAEVAGITVTGTGVVNTDGDGSETVTVGDVLNYNFTIKNVGNDPTKFRIPNLASVTGPATAGNLEYFDGTNWVAITGTELITGSIAPDASIQVRVPVTVQAGATSGQDIIVQLGNTPGDAQNQLRSPDGGDVYTVDNADGTATGEVNGAPVNGVREASDTLTEKVGATLKNYALATVLKTRGTYDNKSTTAITDDEVTYNLSLRVENTDITGQGITPTALEGTNITVSGTGITSTDKHILVSDAIPEGTELAEVPTPPSSDWIPVYTTDAVASTDANAATWQVLDGTTDLTTVTRVGFVKKANTAAEGIDPGDTVTGLTIKLAVKSGTASPLTIANIAQVFGETGDTNADPTVASSPVYDESGDQNPSNFDGGVGSMTPPANTDTNNDGVPDTLPAAEVDDGYINNPTAPESGVDAAGDNTGSGTGGEANVFTITEPTPASVLNGPQNAPGATGPSGLTNDDFTNKSSLVPANTKPYIDHDNDPNTPDIPNTIDPAPVGFTNTIQNSGTDAGNITLVPTIPTGVNKDDLPNLTTVTITYGSDSAVYTYDKSAGTFSGPATPITISNVAAGDPVNYGVEVNLPAGTNLSTNTVADYTGDTEFGFPVPIEATITSVADNTQTATNITIDRVYTGYLKLVKESRVTQGTGPAVVSGDETWSSTPKTPSPGNILEYRIRYSNISDPQAGAGNIILNADKVVITEDGVGNGNNWAKDNDSNGEIDTSNIVGSAQDTGAANIEFYSGEPSSNAAIDQTGTTATTDVTKYVLRVTGNVVPGQERIFTFHRKVNGPAPSGTADNTGL